jgi:hypothetical protein
MAPAIVNDATPATGQSRERRRGLTSDEAS